MLFSCWNALSSALQMSGFSLATKSPLTCHLPKETFRSWAQQASMDTFTQQYQRKNYLPRYGGQCHTPEATGKLVSLLGLKERRQGAVQNPKGEFIERASPRGAVTFNPMIHQLKATQHRGSQGGNTWHHSLPSPVLLPGIPVGQTHLKSEGKKALQIRVRLIKCFCQRPESILSFLGHTISIMMLQHEKSHSQQLNE